MSALCQQEHRVMVGQPGMILLQVKNNLLAMNYILKLIPLTNFSSFIAVLAPPPPQYTVTGSAMLALSYLPRPIILPLPILACESSVLPEIDASKYTGWQMTPE